MRFFVTGATGFVGSQLVRELHDQGHEVVVFHRQSSDLSLLEGVPCERVIGDMMSPTDLARGMSGCDGVFHVAGNVSWYKRDWDWIFQTNVDGSLAVLEAMRQSGVRRGVQTSSVAAVGFLDEKDRAAEETTPFNWPAWMPYPASKRKAEEVWFAAGEDLELIAVNPPSVFGPGDLKMSVGLLFQEVAARKVPRLLRGGLTMCDSRDVARGHLLAFERGKPGERYILGGPNIEHQQLAAKIADLMSVAPPRLPVPPLLLRGAAQALRGVESLGIRPKVPAGHLWCASRYLYHSSEKAIRELGYEPRDVETILSETIEWYRDHDLLPREKDSGRRLACSEK